jgi:hypothetical protein
MPKGFELAGIAVGKSGAIVERKLAKPKSLPPRHHNVPISSL